MKKLAWLAALAALSLAMSRAEAQTPGPLDGVTHQMWPGQYTNTGCPSGITWCFIPYTATNPFPTAGTAIIEDPITTSNRAVVDSGGSLYVMPHPLVLTPTDAGGTIVTGGTAVIAITSDLTRKGGWCKNPPDAATQGIATAENLIVSVTGTASTTPGAVNTTDIVAPGGRFSLGEASSGVLQGAVSLNAATSGHIYICTYLR